MMNRATMLSYIHKIDENLNSKALLSIFGGGVCILYGMPSRTSFDIDVWLPECFFEDKNDFMEACAKSDVLVIYSGYAQEIDKPYIQLVDETAGIVEIGRIKRELAITLFEGKNLTVKSLPTANIVASKLVRCHPHDISDCIFLIKEFKVSREEILNVIDTFRNLTAKEMAKENIVLLDVSGVFDK